MTSINEREAMNKIAQLIRRQATMYQETLGSTNRATKNCGSNIKKFKVDFNCKQTTEGLKNLQIVADIIKSTDETEEDEAEEHNISVNKEDSNQEEDGVQGENISVDNEDSIEAVAPCVENKVQKELAQSPNINGTLIKKKRDLSLKRLQLAGPWENVAEFKTVYNHLYGNDTTKQSQRKALEILRIWSKRRADQCPAAVCATAEILNVQMKSEEGIYNESDMRQLFAHAYTRFFNFMSSTEQTQSQRSMYNTAQSLGLWQWVVDLRHICSHEINLPDLHVLRSSAKFCQDWLKSYYWEEQLKKMQDVGVESGAGIKSGMRKTVFNDITEILNIFDAALESYMRGALKIKTARRFLSATRFRNLRIFFQSNNLNSIDASLAFIVKDINITLRKHATIKDTRNLCLEAVLNMRYLTNDIGRQSDAMLKKLIYTTQGFFRTLSLHGLLEKLVIALFVIVEESDNSTEKKAAAVFWLEIIMRSLEAYNKCKIAHKKRVDKSGRGFNLASLSTDKISKRICEFYEKIGVDKDHILLLSESTTHPMGEIYTNEFLLKRMQKLNKQSAPFVVSLVPLVFPPLSAMRRTGNISLINTFLDTCAENESEVVEEIATIYTMDDIRKLIEKNANINLNEHSSLQSADISKTFDALPFEDLSNLPLGGSVAY